MKASALIRIDERAGRRTRSVGIALRRGRRKGARTPKWSSNTGRCIGSHPGSQNSLKFAFVRILGKIFFPGAEASPCHHNGCGCRSYGGVSTMPDKHQSSIGQASAFAQSSFSPSSRWVDQASVKLRQGFWAKNKRFWLKDLMRVSKMHPELTRKIPCNNIS